MGRKRSTSKPPTKPANVNKAKELTKDIDKSRKEKKLPKKKKQEREEKPETREEAKQAKTQAAAKRKTKKGTERKEKPEEHTDEKNAAQSESEPSSSALNRPTMTIAVQADGSAEITCPSCGGVRVYPKERFKFMMMGLTAAACPNCPGFGFVIPSRL